MALPFPQSTISTGCQKDTGDGPGGVGSRFLAPGEDALTEYVNRAPWALVQNDEYLDNIIAVEEKAYQEVGALNGFSGGSSIQIDPSGGAAGDVNYTGTLYLGDSGWLTGQEAYDTLFQLLDEDYNEILVDGEEVKIASITGNSLGDEFVSTITTLNLSDTILSGNYRLGYARGSTYENLPNYAFIRGDIRGLHEASGEAGRQSVYVLDASSTPDKPADFTGSTALQDALAAINSGGGHCTLFLRSGTYTLPAGATYDVTLSGVSIVGESADPINGTIVQFSPGYSFQFSGDYCWLSNVALELTGVQTGGERLYVNGDHFTGQNISMDNIILSVESNYSDFFDIVCGGYGYGIGVSGSSFCVFKDIKINASTSPTANGVIEPNVSNNIIFENIEVLSASGTNQKGIRIFNVGLTDCLFKNCIIAASGTSSPLTLDNNSLTSIRFENCRFTGYVAALDTGSGDIENLSVVFEHCFFDCLETTNWVKTGPFVRILHREHPTYATAGSGIEFNNCTFRDSRNQGNDSSVDPEVTEANLTGATTQWSIMEFAAVTLNNCFFNRDGVGFNIEGQPWAKFTSCVIDEFTVYTDTSTLLPIKYVGMTATHGLLTFFDDCDVKNVTVKGYYEGRLTTVTPGLEKPIFYVEGATYTDASDSTRDIPAQIDGLKVSLSSNASRRPWRSDGAVLLEQAGDSIVKRLVWDKGNMVSTVSADATQDLIQMFGENNVFEQWRIHSGVEATYGRFLTFIRLSGENHIVRGGKAYWDVSSEFTEFIDMGAKGSRIVENTFVMAGNLGGTKRFIKGSGEACIVSHNLCHSLDGFGSNPQEVIEFTAATFDGVVGSPGPTSAPGGGGVCVGNIVWTSNGTNDPDINPNTIVGYSTNVLGHDASATTPGE